MHNLDELVLIVRQIMVLTNIETNLHAGRYLPHWQCCPHWQHSKWLIGGFSHVDDFGGTWAPSLCSSTFPALGNSLFSPVGWSLQWLSQFGLTKTHGVFLRRNNCKGVDKCHWLLLMGFSCDCAAVSYMKGLDPLYKGLHQSLHLSEVEDWCCRAVVDLNLKKTSFLCGSQLLCEERLQHSTEISSVCSISHLNHSQHLSYEEFCLKVNGVVGIFSDSFFDIHTIRCLMLLEYVTWIELVQGLVIPRLGCDVLGAVSLSTAPTAAPCRTGLHFCASPPSRAAERAGLWNEHCLAWLSSHVSCPDVAAGTLSWPHSLILGKKK